MVKIFFTVAFLLVNLYSDELLDLKIKSFIGEKIYTQNKDFIDIIFTPSENFYTQDKIDNVKVIKTLKDNGLLNLFFKKPQELNLSFTTNGSPLFFLKIMSDTLREIGYYRYVTVSSNLNVSEFTWSISLNSEYATDPIIFQQELLKRGCNIVDIKRESPTKWSYNIDMSDGYLDIQDLYGFSQIVLKRSLYAHWLNVEGVSTLEIKSTRRNSWYPYITYYDKSLHLIKVLKKDKKTKYIKLNIPIQASYIKISDLYTLKNVKDPLILIPK